MILKNSYDVPFIINILQNARPYYFFRLAPDPPSINTKCFGKSITFLRNSDWNSSYCVLIHRNQKTSFLNGYAWEADDLKNFKVGIQHSFMWQTIGRAGKMEYKLVYFNKHVCYPLKFSEAFLANFH